MAVPVYLFTGFLESGKSTFIQETFEDARFEDGKRCLLLVCEQGETEYDESRFALKHFRVEYVQTQEELTAERLLLLQREFLPEKIVVECNGMWMLDELYAALPEDWLVYQQMLFFDATSFNAYNANLRGLVVDKLQSSDMVVFNRVETGTDIMPFHTVVRATSRSCDIAYEFRDGQVRYDDIEDPLPFDLDAETVCIEPRDYAIWYRDLSEETEKYEGKRVSVRVCVARTVSGTNELVVGRQIMTCCEEDITFAGLLCRTERADGLARGAWVQLTAVIRLEDNPVYRRRGPVLYAEQLTAAEQPEQPVATFY